MDTSMLTSFYDLFPQSQKITFDEQLIVQQHLRIWIENGCSQKYAAHISRDTGPLTSGPETFS